ncbi:MAG: 50S ribosomal protein L3 [Clostridia bacterium]|nr:MAG: 50S ribosomal protein L3 [Clostridia bacterium]
MKGILGKKLGMMEIFDEAGEAVPVTVIEAGPCPVVQKKTTEADGYNALQLGFGDQKPGRLNKPQAGHLAKNKVRPVRYLREIRVDDPDAYQVGQEIRVDIFQSGERVDVTGTSKGRGFTGGIQRHGFHRGPMHHGSKYHRRPGSLGAKGPARVFKGRKLPGRAGGERVTVQSLRVVRVDPERNLLLVEGSVPGIRNSLLIIKQAVKG